MRTRTDLYAILGLTRDATPEQINSAYKTLVRRYHPDTRRSGDPASDAASDAALQEVLAAYQVLHDPRRRAAYDQQHNPPPLTLTPTRPLFNPVTRRGNGSTLRAGPAYWTPWPTRPPQSPTATQPRAEPRTPPKPS